MSRIYFDPVLRDGEAHVRCTIIEFDDRGDESRRVHHLMTLAGARIRHHDFEAIIADAEAGHFVDDSLTAEDLLGEAHPNGRISI